MRFVLCALLILPASCFAFTWTAFGPDEASITGWCFHQEPPTYSVLATTTGILLDQGSGWVPFTYGALPCEGAAHLDAERMLVALADSSWSDGIYTFDLTTHQFLVVTWCIHPRFLVHYPDLGAYYAGYDPGLLVSTDGLNWADVPGVGSERCLAMAQHGNHLVVAGETLIHWSDDAGVTWHQAQPDAPHLCDLEFSQDGTLFGIGPGKGMYSGLWSSRDFGDTWERDFWGLFMSSVTVDCDGTVFAGWNNPGSGGFIDCGVAMWNPVSHELIYLNAGLPDSLVNALGSNPLVDCRSIMCGTAAGAHYLTGYLTAPQLGIELTAPSAARLSWAPGGSPDYFDIYRSQNPFPTGTGSAWATVEGTVLQYYLTDGIGDESIDYYYVIRGRDAMQTSPKSGTVGDADFATNIP
ncbi:hypothetical protein JXA88_19285 [Candidatus Fermentibacteria bacterium]|nr:hypothetical protein [Candidatus Fermentibacteria bacterium]